MDLKDLNLFNYPKLIHNFITMKKLFLAIIIFFCAFINSYSQTCNPWGCCGNNYISLMPSGSLTTLSSVNVYYIDANGKNQSFWLNSIVAGKQLSFTEKNNTSITGLYTILGKTFSNNIYTYSLSYVSASVQYQVDSSMFVIQQLPRVEQPVLLVLLVLLVQLLQLVLLV